MKEIPCYQVDAFAARAFTGNPAAVCPLEAWLPDALMQAIAAENNLAETAFYVRDGADFRLRWFTPTVEVDLCGHATLASGFVQLSLLSPQETRAVFHTRSGALVVTREGDRFALDLPRRDPKPEQPPAALVEGLGGAPKEWHHAAAWLALFDREEEVAALRPNFPALAAFDDVIATAPGKNVDFISRYFAPKHGIDEDPVTGSAHSTLAPFWSARLGKKLLRARQISARSGELECELGERVVLRGTAVLVKSGVFHLPRL